MAISARASGLYKELTERIRDEGGVPCENAPDMFFIDKGDRMGPEKIRMSKALCGTCPLSVLCLEYALEANEQDGIWGGLTRNERNSIQRSRVIRERVY
jgi:WhiB family transcriptional regulator, redox-sensing transcriptional regulator